MGYQYFDQYTYLHFALGVVVYFWHISLINWVILHTIFEFLENTQIGIHIINQYIVFWPGGKEKPDTIVNMTGDTTGAVLGWLSAYYLDKLGKNYKWYAV